MEDNLVCVYDFAGNNRQSGRWADYDPINHLLYFGGQWAGIEPQRLTAEPTDKQVYAFAEPYIYINYEYVVE